MFLAACFWRAALLLSLQRRLRVADPASCHISEAAGLLWMEITERWWAEDDLNWLLGKQRRLFADGGLLDRCLNTFVLQGFEKETHNLSPKPKNIFPLKDSILDLYRKTNVSGATWEGSYSSERAEVDQEEFLITHFPISCSPISTKTLELNINTEPVNFHLYTCIDFQQPKVTQAVKTPVKSWSFIWAVRKHAQQQIDITSESNIYILKASAVCVKHHREEAARIRLLSSGCWQLLAAKHPGSQTALKQLS